MPTPSPELLWTALGMLAAAIIGAQQWELRSLRKRVHDFAGKLSAVKGRCGILEMRLSRTLKLARRLRKERKGE